MKSRIDLFIEELVSISNGCTDYCFEQISEDAYYKLVNDAKSYNIWIPFKGLDIHFNIRNQPPSSFKFTIIEDKQGIRTDATAFVCEHKGKYYYYYESYVGQEK